MFWPTCEFSDASNNRISFAELARDFELFTGIRLEDPRYGRDTSWGRRADYMRLLFNAILKYSAGFRRHATELPKGRVVTLGPFGIGAKLQGFMVRPRFLMTVATEKWVASNAIRQAMYNQSLLSQTRTKTVMRDGALGLAPTYQNLVVPAIYRDPDIAALNVFLDRAPPRRRIRGKTKPVTK